MTQTTPLLQGLNPAQAQAVTAADGPVLVLAGPGSGKTRVLTHRIAYVLSELQADPAEILAVTFTNKAAREMRERLTKLVGPVAGLLTVGTFHSICARLLRRSGLPVGLGPDYVIYDDADQNRLVRQVLTEMGLDEKQYSPRGLLSRISAAKSALLTPDPYIAGAQNYFDEVAGRVYRRYQELLEWNQAADFDDLLMKTVQLWEQNPDILAGHRARWRRVLVDEYQDTNHAQYRLIRLLTAEHRNLFVVGDEDQGIYSWRAADITNLLNFERDYPEAQVVLLEQNYRSTQAILEVAGAIISANRQRTPKKLWTDKMGGLPVHVREAFDEQDEAQHVCHEIMRLVGSEGYRHGDIAVMYRTNAQSRAFEDKLVQFRIPYQVVGTTRFWERKEIKDVLAYLRLVHNPYDTASLRRIFDSTPSGKGIGRTTVSSLEAFAARARLPLWDAIAAAVQGGDQAAGAPRLTGSGKGSLERLVSMITELRARRAEMSLTEIIEAVLARSGYSGALLNGTPEGEERFENVRELLTVANDYAGLSPSEALSTFLEEMSLLGDLDTVREGGDAVTLITLHAAKGLEYPVVFIGGMEEGLLPHSRSIDSARQLEEECRLAYVGVTRAMERLYISYAFRRSIFGTTQINQPSRFLTTVPAGMFRGFVPAGPKPSAATGATRTVEPVRSYGGSTSARTDPPPAVDLAPGDRVSHVKFGEGTVLSVARQGAETEVEVRFAAGATKRLLASLARLEKLPSSQ